MSQKTIELRIERNFSAKLSAAFDFIKQNFKGLFKPVLYVALPAALLGGFFLSEYFSMFSSGSLGNTDFFSNSDETGRLILNYLGVLVVLTLGYVIVTAIIFSYISLYDEDRDRDITYSMVFAKLKQRIGRFIGYNFVYGLVACVVLAIVGVICFGPSIFLMTEQPILGFVLYFFMIFVFIFLVLFVSAYSYLLQNVIFLENLSLGKSLSRTFKLLKGNWWSTIGLIIVASFILNILSFIFVIPIYVVMFLNIIGFEMELIGKVFMIVASMLMTFVSFMIIPLLQIPIAVQYFNLTEKKDGTGMLNQIGKIGEIGNNDGFDD